MQCCFNFETSNVFAPPDYDIFLTIDNRHITLVVHPGEIARLTSEQLQLPLVSADEVQPDPMLLASLDPDLVRDARAFPIEIDAGRLRVAMVDPSIDKVVLVLPKAILPATFSRQSGATRM